MSLARITEVKAARKKQDDCGRCGKEINPGDPYLWFKVGFRSNWKRVRCLESSCFPSDGERESTKYAAVWDARDDLLAVIESAEEVDEIRSALDDYAQALRDVASEYEEASTDDNGTVFNIAAQEAAEALENAASEVDGIYLDDVDEESDEPDPMEDIRVQAREAIEVEVQA